MAKAFSPLGRRLPRLVAAQPAPTAGDGKSRFRRHDGSVPADRVGASPLATTRTHGLAPEDRDSCQRMEHEADCEVNQGSDNDRQEVVLNSAHGNPRSSDIGATLERNAVVDRPAEDRAKEDHSTEVAIGK